ncbi:MAG: peptidoglycan-binding protein [Hyphomicrobiaceae bacterium]
MRPLPTKDGLRRVLASSTGPAALAAVLVLILAPIASALPRVPLPGSGPTITHKIAVFAVDDRKVIPARDRRLRNHIGLLQHKGTGSYCTAFCVAPNVIATAGHCVLGTKADRTPSAAQFRFRRDSARASWQAAGIAGWRTGTASLNVVTGAERLHTRPPINASSDWALLRLESDACPAGGLPISPLNSAQVEAQAAEGRVYQVAYHRDIRNWRLAAHRRCNILPDSPRSSKQQISADFEDADRLLLHMCDTEAASSGSPLLIDGPNGPEVVGINVGTYVRSRVITHDGEVVQRLSSETVANTALLAAPVAQRLKVLLATTPAAGREDIEQIQAGLARRGYFAGTLDGLYGPVTREAIVRFERSAGRQPTGLATRELMQLLSAGEVSAATR